MATFALSTVMVQNLYASIHLSAPPFTTLKKSSTYLLILLLALLHSCSPEETDSQVFKVEKAPLDQIALSEYFKVVSVDAIDEGNEDLITDVSKVKYQDSLVYILDRFDGKKISVYNHITGSFLHNIGHQGEGPGGYDIPYDFYVDEGSKTISVLTAGKILKYSSENGKYFDQTPLDLPAVRFIKLHNGHWLFILGRGTKYQVLITDDSFNVIKRHLPRLRMHNMLAWEPIITTDGNRTLIVRNFDNHIYEVTEDNELEVFLQLDFGDNPIPEEDKNTLSKSSEINAKYPKTALLRRNFYASTAHYFFVYQKNKRYKVVAHSLSSNDYINFDVLDVNNDLLLKKGGSFPSIIGMDDKGSLISYVRSNIKQSNDGRIIIDENRNQEALTLIRFKPNF